MTFFDFIDGLIRNPPGWILAVVSVLIATVALKEIYEYATGVKKDRLVETLELAMTITLLALVLKAFAGESIGGGHAEAWYETPFALLVMFVSFTILSGILYFLYRLLSNRER